MAHGAFHSQCGLPHLKRQKSKDFVRKKIMEKVPEDLLHKQISDELFERDYTTIQQQIDEFKKR